MVICIYIYVCVCVWNIWRDVKLLSCTWFFAWGSILSLVFNLKSTKVSNLNFSRGQWISFHPLPNEDGGLRLWYRDRSSRHTCNFPIFRQWQPAKPRTGMSFFNIFQHFSTFSTFFNIFNPTFNLMSVRFPQSVGEVNLLPTRAMEKFRFDSYSSLL